MPQIELCKTPMSYPGDLESLRPASDCLGDPAALRKRLADDGYLYLPGFLERADVQAARARILQGIEKGADGKPRESMPQIAATPELMAVLESPRLFALFADIFGEPALTFDYKWLRAVPPGAYTGLHYDNVYMGRGSDRLHTVWTPFGDNHVRLGSLAILVGSHTQAFKRLQQTYGQIDVDRDNIVGGGWYSHDPQEAVDKYGGRWATIDARMGDVIVIGMFTLHCSTRNLTDEQRLSCDCRFQPAADPVDERWYGPNRTGHTGPQGDPAKRREFTDLKAEWGI